MRFKHITQLNSSERDILFNKYPDVLERVILEVADKYDDEDDITSKVIKDEFYNLLCEMDIVVDTETFKEYKAD